MTQPTEQPGGGHILRVKAGRYSVELDIECHEPVGAPCRLECAEPGCTSDEGLPHYDAETDREHELTRDMGECNDVLWLTADRSMLAETHASDADDEPLFDGMAVDITWYASDHVAWRAAKTEPVGLTAEIAKHMGTYTYDARGSNHARVVNLVADDLRPYIVARVDATYRRLAESVRSGGGGGAAC
jgi:hypothetical protein